MTTAIDTAASGQTLREAREHAGLTRAQLAALAGCSFSQLSNIEQGAVPKTSRVLVDALAAIDVYTSEAVPAQDGSAKTREAARDHARS